MKAIMVMFDSLNRHMLSPYGCDWVHTPNFQRLSEKSVTFDNSYVGSMPCMPARRELHTGRYNFLHRSWGPLEPFDDSMPEILKDNGVYTHIASDHYHYWEDGGCNYHTRFNTWEISRGQEGDPCTGDMNEPDFPSPNPKRSNNLRDSVGRDWVNRGYIKDEADFPQAKTFAMGEKFIEKNKDCDNWFLQLETFDPHEPYFVPEKYKKLYDYDFDKIRDDWPVYGPATDEQLTTHYHFLNAALVSMCDDHLGKILDLMDKHDMWEDTMLIVNTDHGYLLGEHDYWAKCKMPFYNEIAHTPLFIWDPRSGKKGERRKSLVQTIDLPPTLLEFFNQECPKDMHGVPLKKTVENDAPTRDAGLFGLYGGHVNCTDGRYVYMRAPAKAENAPLYQYTHMPTHMKSRFSIEEMRTMEIQPPFDFTKGCPTMKTKGRHFQGSNSHSFGTLLFDLEKDPAQERPLNDPVIEKKMTEHLRRLMKENDAPVEQYTRLGLTND